MTPWQRFAAVARGQSLTPPPVALIVDSPWLPGYAGLHTVDYFVQDETWWRINRDLLDRFPEVAWIPGFWVEYGMAAEPSAYGARVLWHANQPPSIEPVPGGLTTLAEMPVPDPYEHGLMPLVLRRYAAAEARLAAEGLGIHMAAARGPFAVAGWLLGITELMMALKTHPAEMERLLADVTTLLIAWLRAQLATLRDPQGILVLDDLVGLLSPKMFAAQAHPHLARLFGAFAGLIRVYHNDTPCPHLVAPLNALEFEVFNFSHTQDISGVAAQMPGKALMGNVPPLDVMTRGTPAQVEDWARECVRKTGGQRLILSAGGGVSPGTPAASIDALVRAASR